MNLHRKRWGVRTVLALGVAASVAGNVLHAEPDPIARIIAAVPPLAFFAVVEVVSHVPLPDAWYRRWGSVAGLLLVGSVAAWLSYWHMVAVAARYGEGSPHLVPLSVDGLIVVTGLALAELSRRIRATEPARVPAPEPPAGPPEPVGEPDPEPGQALAAVKVIEAHRREPDATNDRIAELADVSLSSVKRHRPKRPINGHDPRFTAVSRT